MVLTLRLLKFIFQLTKPYRWYLGGTFISMCLATAGSPLKSFLVKTLIDTVSGNGTTSLWVACFLYLALQLITVTFWTMSDHCIIKYTASLRLDTAEYFMRRLYDGSYDFFQNQLVGGLISKLNDAFQYLPHLIFIMISYFACFILLTTISIILLASVAPVFAIIMVAWICLFFFIIFLSMKKSMGLNKHYAEEKAKITGLTADYLSNMFSIKIFTTKKFELERFSQLKKSFLEIANRQGSYFMWLYSVQGFFTAIYATGFIAFLIIGYQKGQVGPGDFALVVITNINIIDSLYHLSHTLRDFVANWGSVDQAIALIENIPHLIDKPGDLVLKIEKGNIIFESVDFHYKNTQLLFKNVSTTIVAGQKIGLVGYSGGGKSTFMNLILRLYDVTGGRILIDQQDIRDVTQDSLRHQIAVIPQEPSLFHRTLMENIRYGNIQATDETVIAAAKKAHAHEFIVTLPQGYASLVGERGIKLSGGQRQRIAIARAILKNAPILLLDEATSQLDSITEREIQKSLWALMQNKTTLVIAHRLSTLLHMDRILVFDQGNIIQEGTHQQLLNSAGLYQRLWESQIDGSLPDRRQHACN